MTIEEFLKSDPATDIITEYYYDNKKYRIKLFYGYDEPIFGIIDISDLGTDSYKPNYIILSMDKPEYVYISDNRTALSKEEISWIINKLHSPHIFKDLNYHHGSNWDHMIKLLKYNDPIDENTTMPDYTKLPGGE